MRSKKLRSLFKKNSTVGSRTPTLIFTHAKKIFFNTKKARTMLEPAKQYLKKEADSESHLPHKFYARILN
ncbi:hypothetical protein CVU75_03705 [Candidatus Dependentiae bacterium HGW-Dependentiae-1]|nr:MAG: hypothetical protein CVU75_03705 [Candidatus Dependentiae bacterium HGW-Dependentiae-1]